MATRAVYRCNSWPPRVLPSDSSQTEGARLRRKSHPGAFCTNAHHQPWNGSKPFLLSCLSEVSEHTSDLTRQVLNDVQDFLAARLERFADEQRRFLRDALASDPSQPTVGPCCMGTMPHQASQPFAPRRSSAITPGVSHLGSTGSADSQPWDHRLGYDWQCESRHPMDPRSRYHERGSTMSGSRNLNVGKLRSLKDLETSLNDTLVESQRVRQSEKRMEGKHGSTDAREVTSDENDSKGQLSLSSMLYSRISHLMHLPFSSNAGAPSFHKITPVDDGSSRASHRNSTGSNRLSYQSEESARQGSESTASLRRAHEKSLTSKLAEPEILLSGGDLLAAEARSPKLSFGGILLWLHLWGVAPWCLPGKAGGHLRALARHSNQLLMLLVATLVVAFRIGEVVFGGQKVHTISDMVLAIGCFFCVVANCSVHRCNLFEEDQLFLLNYAKEHFFLRSWCWQSLWHLAETVLGWAFAVAGRAFLHGAEGRLGAAGAFRSVDLAAYSVSTGIFFSSIFCQLHCMNALAQSVDRFGLRFTQDASTAKRIQDWTSLQAMLRQASLAMESSILVLVTTSMLMVFACGVGSIVDPSFGIVQSAIPAAVLWATMGRVLLRSAHVTSRCDRVPPFVMALSAGCEGCQLAERLRLVQFMECIGAGFYVLEIKVTSNAAMKLVYVGCMLLATILSTAVTGTSALAMH